MQNHRSAAKLLQVVLLHASKHSVEGLQQSAGVRTPVICRAFCQSRAAPPQLQQRKQIAQFGRRGYAAEGAEVDTGLQQLEEARRRSKLWQRYGILGMVAHCLPCALL